MAGYTNFDRQYRLALGKAGQDGYEIGEVTRSQPIPLHIYFNIEKSDLEAQNRGVIEVWNLNKEHLGLLNEKDCAVSLRAGYGSNLPLILSGIVSFAKTVKDDADEKTEIEVVDNLVEVRDTYISVAYNGTVNWKTIFDDTAAQMGVAITYSYNAEFKDVPNGFSFIGKARDIITKGCAYCDLSWSIQNGVLQIKKPGDVMSKEVYVLSADSGLIGMPSRVLISESGTGDKEEIGWDVQYLMNGAIHVNDYVKLESRVVNGYFRVKSVEFNGDNVSGEWRCTARLLEVK